MSVEQACPVNPYGNVSSMLRRTLAGTHGGAQGGDGAAYINAFRTCSHVRNALT